MMLHKSQALGKVLRSSLLRPRHSRRVLEKEIEIKPGRFENAAAPNDQVEKFKT